jgi:type IX secretion system PorP/SprF family membrane protein
MTIRIKNTILTAILLFASGQLWSQSNIRPDHYWDNPYYISPAYINNQYVAIVSAAARKQWVNVDGAPVTFWLTGAYYSEDKHMQVGLKVIQDRIGYTTTGNISLSYAYAAILNEDLRLDMGIAGSFQNISYDLSKITAINPGDPSFNESFVNRQQVNGDLGIELTSKIFKLGIACQNIAGWLPSSNTFLPNTNLMYCTYRLCTSGMIDYNFGISEYNTNHNFQSEIAAMAIVKKREDNNYISDNFYLGLFYRFRYELGATLGMYLGSSVSISYSYNYNTSALKYNAAGTHELILSYRFRPKPVCHSCY